MFSRLLQSSSRTSSVYGQRWMSSSSVHGEKLMERFKSINSTRSFDKNDKNVGTGIVGAPACFHGDTMIVTKSGLVKMCDITGPIEVLSFNQARGEFEYRLAVPVQNGVKNMDIVYFDENTRDYGKVVCTGDHKFLIRETGVYLENSEITPEMTVVPFKQKLAADSELCHKGHTKYGHKITRRESFGEAKCYTLQVEENNNYIVVISETQEQSGNCPSEGSKNLIRGIVVKNCGDVLKIQIKVDDNGKIVDSCFKTFGCVSAISSSSLGSEIVIGKSLQEAMNVKNTEIANALALEPIKNHCSMLTEEGIKESVRDFLEKNPHMKDKVVLSAELKKEH
jgi:NifU-like protein involved in Fe-S cluster formation